MEDYNKYMNCEIKLDNDYILGYVLSIIDVVSDFKSDNISLNFNYKEIIKLNDYIKTLEEKNRQLIDLCNMLSKKKDIVNLTKEVEEI